MLSACSANITTPYQKDITPENRREYSGVEGMVQYQKDKRYLMDKELADKCNSAKIELIVAESENNASEIKKQHELIKNTCV